MLNNLFGDKKRSALPETVPETMNPPPMEPNIWARCDECKGFVYERQLVENLKVCPKCGYSQRLGYLERIEMTCDEETFEPIGGEDDFSDPIGFPGYEEKWRRTRTISAATEGVMCGEGSVGGHRCVVCVMDSSFFMGSMGRIVGERVTLAFEHATERSLPIVIFTASGGARMQEGIISLMQMTKVSAARRKHGDAGLFYLTVITDPTTGGVTASFATLGDIILAEKDAMFGFAGRRVIEQTLGRKLPKGFQTAEFALEHGLVDAVCERKDLKQNIAFLLGAHGGAAYGG